MSSQAGPAIDLTGEILAASSSAAAASEEEEQGWPDFGNMPSPTPSEKERSLAFARDVEAASSDSDEEGLPKSDLHENHKMSAKHMSSVLGEIVDGMNKSKGVPKRTWKVECPKASNQGGPLGIAAAFCAAIRRHTARQNSSQKLSMFHWWGDGDVVFVLSSDRNQPLAKFAVEMDEKRSAHFMLRMGPACQPDPEQRKPKSVDITERVDALLQKHFCGEEPVSGADVFHRILGCIACNDSMKESLKKVLDGVERGAANVLVDVLARNQRLDDALAAERAKKEASDAQYASKQRKVQQALSAVEAIAQAAEEKKPQQRGPRRSSRARTAEERLAQEAALEVQNEIAEVTGRPAPSSSGFEGLRPNKWGRYP